MSKYKLYLPVNVGYSGVMIVRDEAEMMGATVAAPQMKILSISPNGSESSKWQYNIAVEDLKEEDLMFIVLKHNLSFTPSGVEGAYD